MRLPTRSIGSFASAAPGFVIGAAIAGALTILIQPYFGLMGRGSVLAVLVLALVLLFIRFTRPVGVGFFTALLLLAIPSGKQTRGWWEPVRFVAGRAIAPAKQIFTAQSKKREWIAVRRSEALDLDKAIFRARQLQSGCVRAAMEVSSGRVPTAEELTAPDDCRDFRRDALGLEAAWPERYDLRNDAGWRWTLSRTSWPSRWPGPGFLLTLSPDPLLGRDGPVLELDGIDVLRLRESPRAPARIVYTPVPALQRLRECLQAAATTIPREDLRRLLYLPGSTEMRRACPDMRVESTGSNTQGDEKLVVKFREPPAAGAHLSLEYEVRYRVVGAGHVELRTTLRYRHFLLDADGAMHVTTEERDAELSDGAPLPCEVDPTVACP